MVERLVIQEDYEMSPSRPFPPVEYKNVVILLFVLVRKRYGENDSFSRFPFKNVYKYVEHCFMAKC